MATDSVNVEQTIRDMGRMYEQAVARQDVSALISQYYAPDALVLAPGAPMARGGEQIRAVLQGLVDLGAVSLALESVRIESSGDLAYEAGHYSLGFGSGMTDIGKYIVVFKRQPDGSLRAVADSFNSDQAME